MQGTHLPVVDDARAFVTRALDTWSSMRAEAPKAYATAMDTYHAQLGLVRA